MRSISPIFGRFTSSQVVTLLVGIVAAALVGVQVYYALLSDTERAIQAGDEQLFRSLYTQHQRVALYRQHLDPEEREGLGLTPAEYARHLDRQLAPNTRIFLTGVLGKDRGSRNTMYFFLRNYLFPRDIEISLDGKAIQTAYGFEGVTFNSVNELREAGYDVLIDLKTNNAIGINILTPKGLPK